MRTCYGRWQLRIQAARHRVAWREGGDSNPRRDL